MDLSARFLEDACPPPRGLPWCIGALRYARRARWRICDDAALTAAEPPLLVKAQMVVLSESGEATWTKVLLDKGTVPVEVVAPPPGSR